MAPNNSRGAFTANGAPGSTAAAFKPALPGAAAQ
jgi:hypothetical protein